MSGRDVRDVLDRIDGARAGRARHGDDRDGPDAFGSVMAESPIEGQGSMRPVTPVSTTVKARRPRPRTPAAR